MRSEIILGVAWILGYYIAFIFAALLFRIFVKIPKEVFRKLLHIIAMCSVFLLIYGPMTWQSAAVVSLFFAAIIYPILALAELIPQYSHYMTERKNGELKRSLIVFYLTLTILILVCWGKFQQKHLVTASVLAWGLGDAAAALIGKKFGKRYISGSLVEGKKTLEGTMAMFIVAFIAVLVVLLCSYSMPWYAYLAISALTAAASALVELYTKKGLDNLTCPLVAAIILLPLTYIFI